MVHLRKLFQTFMVNAFLKITYCGLNHSFEELIEDQLPDDENLHAYKVEGHDHENQWVSIGHPFLIKNKNGGIYQFTPESIFMKLRLLAEDQRTALKNIAKQFYPNIKEALIYLIPLQSLSCATSFLAGEETIELQGKANNLNQYEVTVEIPCEEHSSVRNAFLNRIKRADSINWRCTFSADAAYKSRKTTNWMENSMRH
uniref:Uncharacterized protein n=1 Tax=Romanomermis culicivorax TaxID=13658 RepID=A0A915KVU0_ROMCU